MSPVSTSIDSPSRLLGRRLLICAGPVLVIALGGLNFASAQSASPFAKVNKRQAWEQAAPSPQPTQQSAPQAPSTYTPSTYTPTQQAPTQYVPAQAVPQSYPTYDFTPQPSSQPAQNLSQSYQPSSTAQQSLSGASSGGGTNYDYGGVNNSVPKTHPAQPQYAPAQYGQGQYGQGQYEQGQYNQNQYPQTYYPQTPQSQPVKESWKDKWGLENIATFFRGRFNIGVGLTDRNVPKGQPGAEDGLGLDSVIDGYVEGEASAVTQGGAEYGVHLGLAAQHDRYRRGFGGRLPDCPPTIAGCSSAGGRGLRGHSSGFYQTGRDTAKSTQVALESAHLFLRTAYGDVTFGRDDGAAYLFSLGAPSLLNVGASNSPVDYTGLDSVKTINDASGFAEKLTYMSPRLLGDEVGVGVQLGASYAFDAKACGVDYCNTKSIPGVSRPDLENVIELGVALDRTFNSGLAVEGTVTYATASEASGRAGLDDLSSLGFGLDFEQGDWRMGGSWLMSNNALKDGDYTAYDFGVTYQPSALGFTLGYGYASDDNVGLTSDQVLLGTSYEFEKFTLGGGLQYMNRSVRAQSGTSSRQKNQKSTGIFVEAGFKF